MVNILWKAWLDDQAQDIARVCGDVGGDSRCCHWYDPIGGFERQQCVFVGCELGSVRIRRSRILRGRVADFSGGLGRGFCVVRSRVFQKIEAAICPGPRKLGSATSEEATFTVIELCPLEPQLNQD
jgi:hypothetical protein